MGKPAPVVNLILQALKISIKKEASQLCRNNERNFKSKIVALSATEINKTKQKIHLTHDIKLTMVDDKVLTFLRKRYLQNIKNS